ncbi:MAG: STAS domain-containing protein [Lachnospiraceae bacterium]|nr:STAS domain-containing protein [Lachnospiraceae bacterium]
MLNIDLKNEGGNVTIVLDGMLDTNTSAEFKDRLNEIPNNATKVTVDMEKLKYTSSAGLRVILGLQNEMDKNKTELVFCNVNEVIQEVFDDTGFSDFIKVE